MANINTKQHVFVMVRGKDGSIERREVKQQSSTYKLTDKIKNNYETAVRAKKYKNLSWLLFKTMTKLTIVSVSPEEFDKIQELNNKTTQARLLVGLIRNLKLENIVLKMLRGYW